MPRHSTTWPQKRVATQQPLDISTTIQEWFDAIIAAAAGNGQRPARPVPLQLFKECAAAIKELREVLRRDGTLKDVAEQNNAMLAQQALLQQEIRSYAAATTALATANPISDRMLRVAAAGGGTSLSSGRVKAVDPTLVDVYIPQHDIKQAFRDRPEGVILTDLQRLFREVPALNDCPPVAIRKHPSGDVELSF